MLLNLLTKKQNTPVLQYQDAANTKNDITKPTNLNFAKQNVNGNSM